MKLYFAPNTRAERTAWLLEELGLSSEWTHGASFHSTVGSWTYQILVYKFFGPAYARRWLRQSEFSKSWSCTSARQVNDIDSQPTIKI